MLADTDASNIITAADAGARWSYRLLPLLLIPALAMGQIWRSVSASSPAAASET